MSTVVTITPPAAINVVITEIDPVGAPVVSGSSINLSVLPPAPTNIVVSGIAVNVLNLNVGATTDGIEIVGSEVRVNIDALPSG